MNDAINLLVAIAINVISHLLNKCIDQLLNHEQQQKHD